MTRSDPEQILFNMLAEMNSAELAEMARALINNDVTEDNSMIIVEDITGEFDSGAIDVETAKQMIGAAVAARCVFEVASLPDDEFTEALPEFGEQQVRALTSLIDETMKHAPPPDELRCNRLKTRALLINAERERRGLTAISVDPSGNVTMNA